MYGDPRPRGLGELVVHVVGLVQEQLQHQPVVRPGQCDFPHGHLERETVSQGDSTVYSLQYFGAQARVESEAVSVLWMSEGVPVPI